MLGWKLFFSMNMNKIFNIVKSLSVKIVKIVVRISVGRSFRVRGR